MVTALPAKSSVLIPVFDMFMELLISGKSAAGSVMSTPFSLPVCWRQPEMKRERAKIAAMRDFLRKLVIVFVLSRVDLLGFCFFIFYHIRGEKAITKGLQNIFKDKKRTTLHICGYISI